MTLHGTSSIQVNGWVILVVNLVLFSKHPTFQILWGLHYFQTPLQVLPALSLFPCFPNAQPHSLWFMWSFPYSNAPQKTVLHCFPWWSFPSHQCTTTRHQWPSFQYVVNYQGHGNITLKNKSRFFDWIMGEIAFTKELQDVGIEQQGWM